MANKDRNKRSGRKARAEERARVESQQTATAAPNVKPVKANTKPAVKTSKNSNGIFARIGRYFKAVRSEMRKVVWPSREELRNYSIAVIAMLVVFGVAIWLIDTGVTAALVAFAGLGGN
ncbi:MAG: preprotein translocase subunit SecE [Atopobiaceae bacterium]|nr:preprotein translocase subunit SecE [Atopobiaceae bacterium]